MPHICGTDRSEILLFPEALDDYITTANPVRFIDAFVDSLDLVALGFTHATPAETGRPAYNPADLLRLYIYGYLNRMRSSRLLERETHRNIEVMWLVGKLTPDFKTIADFRKDNLMAIKSVCREFTLVCQKLELFGGELVAVDGSKFRAVNSRKRNFSQQKLERSIRMIDEKISAYLKQMDQEDAAQPAAPKPPTAEELRQKMQQLTERRGRYQALQKHLKQSGEKQVSLTDPDSRSMPVGLTTEVSYNVQTAVDAKHKLIVAHEVTNAVIDREQLAEMAIKAKEALGVKELEVIADMGYSDAGEIKRCEDQGITAYVAQPQTSINHKKGLYTKRDFTYLPERDCYECPAGAELGFRFASHEKGRDIKYYASSVCQSCQMKQLCTTNKGGRRLTRLVEEGSSERAAQRARDNPEKMRLRQQIVEHPFGTIKRAMNSGYFLLKGLEKVGAEMSLTVLAYNIKRAVNLLGVEKLIGAVT